MKWYYVEQGKQAGPIDDAQLEALLGSGAIQPETLVWREGMANWVPYSEAKGAAAAGGAPGSQSAPGSSAETSTEAVCTECGKIFPVNSMIRHGNAHVCANCKPIFMQKLAEGASIGAGLKYAGFWIRFAAVFMDGIILWVVNFAISMATGMTAGQAVGIEPNPAIAKTLMLVGIQLAIGISYEVFLIGKYGATLGKMACKIQVVTADGGSVSYLRAFGRYFAKLLSGMLCLIGYIIAAFDGQKRALHDHICNTRVIHNS